MYEIFVSTFYGNLRTDCPSLDDVQGIVRHHLGLFEKSDCDVFQIRVIKFEEDFEDEGF